MSAQHNAADAEEATKIWRRIPADSPEAAEVRAHLDRFAEDGRRLLALRPELLAKWPEQYVALSGERLFHNSDFEALLRELRDNDIEPGHTIIRYFTDRLRPHVCFTRL